MNHSPSSHVVMSNQLRPGGGHRMLRACLKLMLAAPFSFALAHPGHDHVPLVPPQEPAHWFVEPEHAAVWLALALAVWATRRPLRSEAPQTAKVRNPQP